MNIQEFFSEECEKLFLIHKASLIEKTSFNEKKNNLKAEDYPKFDREFKRFQRQISLNLTKLIKKNRKTNVEEILEPIANKYTKSFLNLVDLSKIDLEKN
ncbi:hypothetical protein [Flavobacterium seoulense]|uniref:Uncharacterized protein n=1 Tax=Flavobacterium seoulense TaxID=1492738 RepID=A0A066WPM1_9FLAO|nr:hypothetical protein [Flavobacterium seoulense]KDN55997.1 hypothetical protein FEM21_08960 [Flavobacterium seoulense]